MIRYVEQRWRAEPHCSQGGEAGGTLPSNRRSTALLERVLKTKRAYDIHEGEPASRRVIHGDDLGGCVLHSRVNGFDGEEEVRPNGIFRIGGVIDIHRAGAALRPLVAAVAGGTLSFEDFAAALDKLRVPIREVERADGPCHPLLQGIQGVTDALYRAVIEHLGCPIHTIDIGGKPYAALNTNGVVIKIRVRATHVAPVQNALVALGVGNLVIKRP